jgi:hypothetical protein
MPQTVLLRAERSPTFESKSALAGGIGSGLGEPGRLVVRLSAQNSALVCLSKRSFGPFSSRCTSNIECCFATNRLWPGALGYFRKRGRSSRKA